MADKVPTPWAAKVHPDRLAHLKPKPKEPKRG